MSAWTKAATPRKTGQPRQSCRSVSMQSSWKAQSCCNRSLCFTSSHWFLLFNVTNAALTAFVLRDLLPVRMFVGWVGLFCIVILARLLNHKRYLRRPPQMRTAANWGWRYAAGATATGCLWGLTAAGILITPNPGDHAFIAFVVGGMMAGAVAGDSAFLPALIGFAVPAALPITFAFFARGDSTSTIMGFMVAAFTAVLGIVGFHSNRWIASVARREIIQRGLATDLARQSPNGKPLSVTCTEAIKFCRQLQKARPRFCARSISSTQLQRC